MIPVECLWFAGGALSYAVFSKLLGLSTTIILLQRVSLQALKLLGIAASDAEFARMMKYKYLKDTNVSEEQMKEVKRIDEEIYNHWRQATIERYMATFPKKYRALLKFHDWDTAMSHLLKTYADEVKFRGKFGDG